MADIIDPKQIAGLSAQQASQRLLAEGYNELPSSHGRSVLAIGLGVVREPMFLLLVGCGVLYLFMGDKAEAGMLLGFVFVVMGITIYQERRTEHALDALRDLSSPRALVIRDGRHVRIAGREVVREDVIVLSEGDRVPADAVVIWAINLAADESLLTGESVPVRKGVATGPTETCRPGGDDLPIVYSGTLITGGQGIARVLATGMSTELGKIGKALESVVPEQTLLQKETGRLVRIMAVVGLSACVAVVVLYALTRGNTPEIWKEGLLAGIALAMATLPEEFPVVLTIFLALGAWRISQSRVLTRRIPAVETLGAATVLCVDKTGTLTQNQMSVSRLWVPDQAFSVDDPGQKVLPETFHTLLEFGILASKRDPFDPMEKALKQLGLTYLARTEHLHENWTLVREYPLSPGLLALSHVWKSPDGQEFVLAAKGAPEAIADLCHLDSARQAEMSQRAADMANQGLRVLGVARGAFRQSNLPSGQHDLDFEFLGLVALADPIRPAVPAAIAECYAAGIRVVMITGDYPLTAQNIARQIGLRNAEEVITGPELEAMTHEDLTRRIRNVNVFARVVPEQKLAIVQALKANREIVAMTGDGVNDAPALKAAHIGIAMGGRGTDVAREAAGLVLLDDDFTSIVQAVRLGRRIFDNIRKAISYILAVHVPIAGLSMIPVFFSDWKLILLPVHIVFLELIIDPACSVAFEAEVAEENVMRRPPRDPGQRLFSAHATLLSLLQGLVVLLVTLAVYIIARALHPNPNQPDPTSEARALAFATLVVANVCLILTNRSWTRTILSMFKVPNRAVWWVIGGAVAFLGLVLYVPFLQDLFKFAPVDPLDLGLCLLAGVVSIIWFEIIKVVNRGKRQPADVK